MAAPGVSAGARVLITGGSGFIGTNAVAYFRAAGCEVRSLDCRPAREPSHEQWRLPADIRDAGAVRAAVAAFPPDYVLHLAARTDLLETRSLDGYAANVAGVRHVLEALESVPGLRRVVVASSRMVCRIGHVPASDTEYDPPNLYGESKVRTEQITRERPRPFEWVLVRPTSIWGEWFEIPYRTFFNSIQRRVFLQPGRHDPVKSFGYVGNTVHQLDRLLVTPVPGVVGGTLYLCDYPPLHLRAWADLIRRAMALPPIPTVPVALLRALALTGDALEALGIRHAPLTSFRLDNLLTPMAYPTPLLERACGPLPFSLEEGVRRTVAWMARS